MGWGYDSDRDPFGQVGVVIFLNIYHGHDGVKQWASHINIDGAGSVLLMSVICWCNLLNVYPVWLSFIH